MNPLELLHMQRKAFTLYERECRPVCRRYGINQTCFDVLMFLANHREYNTARDICMVRGIKTGLASVAVELLIEKGFLARRDDPEDRRVKRLQLTEAAEPLAAEGRRLQLEFGGRVVEGISREELDIYKRITERLVDNISRMEKGEMRND